MLNLFVCLFNNLSLYKLYESWEILWKEQPFDFLGTQRIRHIWKSQTVKRSIQKFLLSEHLNRPEPRVPQQAVAPCLPGGIWGHMLHPRAQSLPQSGVVSQQAETWPYACCSVMQERCRELDLPWPLLSGWKEGSGTVPHWGSMRAVGPLPAWRTFPTRTDATSPFHRPLPAASAKEPRGLCVRRGAESAGHGCLQLADCVCVFLVSFMWNLFLSVSLSPSKAILSLCKSQEWAQVPSQ